MGFAVYHAEKGTGGSGGIGNHIDRAEGQEHSYEHADPTKKDDNINLTPSKYASTTLPDSINIRIADGYKGKTAIRKDAVKFITHIMSGSHEEMKMLEMDRGRFKEWIAKNYKFIAAEFGEDNVVRFNVHLDEKTPHIHAVTVPLTKDGRMSAKELFGNKTDMSKRQDRYADAMVGFQLNRGIKYTGVKHESAKQYYGRINEAETVVEQSVSVISEIIDNTSLNLLNTNFASVKAQLKEQIMAELKKDAIIKEQALEKQKNADREILKKLQSKAEYSKLRLIAMDIKKEVPILNYFAILVKSDVLQYETQRNGKYYFKYVDAPKLTKFITVDEIKGSWYDYNKNQGGDLIAAVQKFVQKTSFADAVYLLSDMGRQQTMLSCGSLFKQETPIKEYITPNEKYLLTGTFAKIKQPRLIKYIEQRGLLSAENTKDLLCQVHYTTNNGIEKCGLGFKNNKDGWVLYSEGTKEFLGNVNISTHLIAKQGEPSCVKIFEDVIDLLSYQVLNPMEKYVAIVLNATTTDVLDNAIDYLKKGLNSEKYHQVFSKVETYFKNSDIGKESTEYLKKTIHSSTQFVDASKKYYEHHKECRSLNEVLLKNTKMKNNNQEYGRGV